MVATWSAGCAALDTLSRKSDTAAAILYALKLWPVLLRYCDGGAIEIDNSAAERALRGVAIGRRKYLCAGADSGGERAAAIYPLIGTAKLTRPFKRRNRPCGADGTVALKRSCVMTS